MTKTTEAYDANAALESNVQLGFPTLPVAGSPLHTKLLREWIQDCDTTHRCLGSPNEPFLPTRLLDVGKRGSTRTRLICNTSMLDAEKDKYLALSHRWGSPPEPGEPDPLRETFVYTFEKNIDTIACGIDDFHLPKKYRDAISVARRLDVQYLWIDSLCIIQEDKSDPFDKDKGQDFKKEAERMERVFRSAYAALAACCASSSDEPFLKRRRARQCVTMQAGEALYYLCDAIDDFSGDVEQGALNKRGWVFQERALSRRTIHFTETQTYWECGEGVRFSLSVGTDRLIAMQARPRPSSATPISPPLCYSTAPAKVSSSTRTSMCATPGSRSRTSRTGLSPSAASRRGC